MEWLRQYWWIILIILLGIFYNGIKALNRLSFKSYLEKKQGIKPILYQDDDDNDEWPDNNKDKS